MTTNSQLSKTEPKKQKQTKQTIRNRFTEIDHMECYQWGEWEKGTGNNKQKW